MPTQLDAYISFKDDARQAMKFYKSVFGGELSLSTFGSYTGTTMSQDPAEADKIMHALLVTDGGLRLMGADTPSNVEYHEGARIRLALGGNNEAELQGYFEKLSSGGGKITMPLEKAPWGDSFGMCTDQFGLSWMFNIEAPKPDADAA